MSGTPRQCHGSDKKESGPDDQLPVQEESTRHEGGDGAEIPAAQGSGDPDQLRMDVSEGAASSSGQGSKRTASQAGLPENADVSFPQGTKRVGSESTESGIEPVARRQKIAEGTASTVRNDEDSDVQVTDANTSSFEDPSSGLSSIASVCWEGEKHIRRDQVVDAFRSDCVDIDEKEAQEISACRVSVWEIGTPTRICCRFERSEALEWNCLERVQSKRR